MAVILNSERALTFILIIVTPLICGTITALLNLPPIFILAPLSGFVIGLLILRWFVKKVRLVGALSVIGVVILSGFLGSFAGVINFISPLYNTVRWVAPLLLMIIGIRNILRRRNILQYLITIWGSISIPILSFVFYALSSTLYSSAPLITMGRAVTFTTITIGLAAALWPVIRQQADAERILRLIALVMGLIILPGELYIFFPDSIGWHSSGRFRSTFWNPVTFSHLCALLLPLYWWIGIDRTIKSGWRLASKVMMGVLIMNIYLTGSRSGALALFFIILFLSWHFTSRRNRHLINWLILTTLTFAIVLNLSSFERYLTRGAALNNYYQITSYRFSTWQVGLTLWADSPVFGSGFGVIGNTDKRLLEGRSSSHIRSSTAGLRLSNLYIETLASGGLIGAGLLLYLLFKSFMMFLRALKPANREKRLMMYMALAIFISGLILNLFETWIISAGSPFAMYWWLVLFLASRIAGFDEGKQLMLKKSTKQSSIIRKSPLRIPSSLISDSKHV